ncbi:hypothetical protein PFICI_03801 [Pestalotiopsis fici W106-1]|uniref:Selenoprotein W-like protein n=1 Tax=Pestalotiopsis fici (strain W106-1 / CGMCC3.15140) TaxID=1229662 RepID=W3XKN1_PESFW|nr:uncharacterized protein PFICI_03801 [Pestalotiopsis fici W106-1]ETS85776.1 hypothetical protein PFICI_03801 [Pestalotiopsis fici W106-1]
MAEAVPLHQPQEVASSIVATGTEDPAFPFPLPRVTIRFCTQCKWMLRAAYFAQELLSTFSTSLGEVALQPSTGGTFVVTIQHNSPPSSPSEASTLQTHVLWDRKTDGGFPETKELKRRVRDVIEPGRNLGHVDRDHQRPIPAAAAAAATGTAVDTTIMTDQQQGSDTTGAPPPPPGPRWPTSDSAQQPQSGAHNPDPIRRGHSRPMIPADEPATGTAQAGAGGGGGGGDSDEYQPKMPRGGVKPVVKPPGEARNAEVRAKLEKTPQEDEGSGQAQCEDCQ